MTKSIVDILAYLEHRGIEPDQKLRRAIDIATVGGTPTDARVFRALYEMNVIAARYLNIQPFAFANARAREFYDLRVPIPTYSGSAAPAILRRIVEKCADQAAHSGTLGARAFVRETLHEGFKTGDKFALRPYTVDMLVELFGHAQSTRLTVLPRIQELMEELARSVDDREDFEYILAVDGDRIVFRVTSILDDYVQASASGVLRPHRAILTHFKDQFGGFTEDEILELQDLLNSPSVREEDFQQFFESHQHFFRRWDCREVHPHVFLKHAELGDLVPDFILTDRELQKALILELKLPTPKLVRRQQNRDRFAGALWEARTQLFRYRDWFRSDTNRASLKGKLGMEVYEPDLAVIVGRSSEFRDAVDRRRLLADASGIEVVTYDDILTYAERRRLVIRPDTGRSTS